MMINYVFLNTWLREDDAQGKSKLSTTMLQIIFKLMKQNLTDDYIRGVGECKVDHFVKEN